MGKNWLLANQISSILKRFTFAHQLMKVTTPYESIISLPYSQAFDFMSQLLYEIYDWKDLHWTVGQSKQSVRTLWKNLNTHLEIALLKLESMQARIA